MFRLFSWRHGSIEKIGGQVGGYGQLTIRTQQGFITLFDRGVRKDSTTRGAVKNQQQRRRVARSGNIKRPWGW
jgi:hypothetical protein